LIPNLENVIYITSSYQSSFCLNKNGEIYGFGRNFKGELGISNANLQSNPQKMILPNKNIKKISVGAYFVLVLDTNGLLYGTGENTVK